MDFETISQYIEPKLLVIVPTLWGLGMALQKSKVENKYIPFILLIFSCLVTASHIFSRNQILDFNYVMSAIFATVTQGCIIWLVAWTGYEKFLNKKE